MLTNDLGIIALFDGDRLEGYVFAVGGGLGMTHNKAHTYPRLGSYIAFIEPEARELLAGGAASLASATTGQHPQRIAPAYACSVSVSTFCRERIFSDAQPSSDRLASSGRQIKTERRMVFLPWRDCAV